MDELWQAFFQITASVNALMLGAVIIFSRKLHRTSSRQKLGIALLCYGYLLLSFTARDNLWLTLAPWLVLLNYVIVLLASALFFDYMSGSLGRTSVSKLYYLLPLLFVVVALSIGRVTRCCCLPVSGSCTCASSHECCCPTSAGWPRFKALKRQHRDAEWLEYLDGSPVGQMMLFPKWLVELLGRNRLPSGLDWHCESTALLQQCEVPMAWLLATEDSSAPNEQTIAKLGSLIESGKAISLTLFPGADHGTVTFTKHGGEVTYTGYAPGYFPKEVEELQRLSQ